MYGEKGVRYIREDMDIIKIRKITEVNDIHIDDVEDSSQL